MEIGKLTAVQLSATIKKKELTVKEAVAATLQQIKQRENVLGCYITVDEAYALKRAEMVQKGIEEEKITGVLAGVPVAVKDNICTKGMRTTCGSKMLEDFVPSYSAEAVERMEAAGMIILGKTNMDEFAMGSTTENSAFGATANPFNQAYVPGGSSGGSAAAVASGECFLAIGSDTGGSVRQPAAHCGVVGLKPTYGTVSRYGLVAYASSLEQIGPITKNVEDCAAILEVLASYDKKDSTSVARADTAFGKTLKNGIEGMRIGIPEDYMDGKTEPAVRKAIFRAAEILQNKGAVTEFFHIGMADYIIPCYYLLAAAEASSNLARYDGVKYGRKREEGFGAEVKRRILLGTYILQTGYYDKYYLKAQQARTLIKQAYEKAFLKYDILLMPTAIETAPEMERSLTDREKMYLNDRNTAAVNLAGLPAISIPGGLDEKGLPIGLQLVADCFAEKKLLQTAYAYEQQ